MTRILSALRNPSVTQQLRPSRDGFPIADERGAYRRHLIVQRDQCPECGHALDTGWECLNCFHDGRAEARQVIDAAIAGEEADELERFPSKKDGI